MALARPPSQSIDWTKERIAALSTLDIQQLRENAERLNRPEIKERCDQVLVERKAEKRAAMRKKKAPAAKAPAAAGGA
jgi:hypothetical protein